jgi:hypothetical protein
VLNNIKKRLSQKQLTLPLMGLVIMVSAVIAHHAKPVLSNQRASGDELTTETQAQEVPIYTWLQRNSSPSIEARSKEARLRRALATSNSVAKIEPQAQEYFGNTTNIIETPAKNRAQLRGEEIPLKYAKTTGVKLPKQDGIYLYGESPKPNEIGKGYIIFENQQGNLTGALYMPNSEFSCFNGNLNSSGELAMTVTGYPGDVTPTKVATSGRLPRLDQDEPTIYTHSVALQNYHPLSTISANDRQILQTCKANQ